MKEHHEVVVRLTPREGHMLAVRVEDELASTVDRRVLDEMPVF
jgi:hypothetical protein